jgi:hypothetical protein
MTTTYRSLDYADNVRLLLAKGYRYLTFYAGKQVPCEDLENEPGYERVLFLEAIPSVKPMETEGENATCLPIESEDAVILLDSDIVSYQVDARYF